MKPLLAVPSLLLALLLGIFLGGLGPRAELRRAQQALDEAKASAERAEPSTLPLALGGLFGGGARNGTPAAAPPPRFVAPPEPNLPEAIAAAPAAPRDAGPARPSRFEEGFPQMKAAADLRAAQHRAAFLERARLSAEKTRLLDELVARMNRDLSAEVERAAAALVAKPGRLEPRDFVDVGVKLLGAYQKADDDWKRDLDPAVRAAMEESRFDLLTQVDVGALRSLGELMSRAEANGRGDR